MKTTVNFANTPKEILISLKIFFYLNFNSFKINTHNLQIVPCAFKIHLREIFWDIISLNQL